ncbi:MAG: B12-binding domain-containing radical SAM protein, partial [Desulfatiglandales bacterium]
MMHERPFGLREKELDPGKQKVDIVLFSPPVWSPVMPFLAIPTLMGYLRAKGIKAIQFDLSIDFFIDHLLTPLNLEKAMETIRRRGYGEGLPQNLQRLSEDLLRSGEKYKDIPQRVEDAKGVLRDKEYFFDIKRMLEAQSYLYRALEILSLSQYPIIFTFNTFSHREVRDFPSLFQFITKGENLFSSFYQTYVFELLKRYSPKLIGISISTSHQMIPGLTLATMLKNHFQDVTIVIGGRQVDRLLDTFVTFTEYSKKFCDILVYGDGELALEGLWECLKGTTNQSKIPNIVWFQEDTVVRSDKFQYIPITQKPSPCFFGIPFHKYLSPYPLIPVRFSEGCYWGKCSFCSRYDNRRFQTLSVDRAVKLLKSLSEELNTQFFMINDDCLTPKYLEALARGILEGGMEINLSLWAKPVSGFTRERLELLSKAGVRLIRWGIETGNERI